MGRKFLVLLILPVLLGVFILASCSKAVVEPPSATPKVVERVPSRIAMPPPTRTSTPTPLPFSRVMLDVGVQLRPDSKRIAWQAIISNPSPSPITVFGEWEFWRNGVPVQLGQGMSGKVGITRSFRLAEGKEFELLPGQNELFPSLDIDVVAQPQCFNKVAFALYRKAAKNEKLYEGLINHLCVVELAPTSTVVSDLTPTPAPIPVPTATPTPAPTPTPIPAATPGAPPSTPSGQARTLFRNESESFLVNLPARVGRDDKARVCLKFERGGAQVGMSGGLGITVRARAGEFGDCILFDYIPHEQVQIVSTASGTAESACFDRLTAQVYVQENGVERWIGDQPLIQGRCEDNRGFSVKNPVALVGNPAYDQAKGIIAVVLENQSRELQTVFPKVTCVGLSGHTVRFWSELTGEFAEGGSFEMARGTIEFEARISGLPEKGRIRECILTLS